jgi:polyisoprenoid-binding protein YceI
MPLKWALLATVAATQTAHAAPTEIALTPSTAQVTFTSYALSLFPVGGHFTRFRGTLRVDPAHPEACAVSLKIEAASLIMASPARTSEAIGPKILDAAAFPTLTYKGDCTGGQATGDLTLHGTTRTITLQTVRSAGQVAASGNLLRQDYGINGLPGLVGRTIRVGFTANLPPQLASLPK